MTKPYGEIPTNHQKSIPEPTARAKAIVKTMENPENWKLPLKPFPTEDPVLAQEVEYAVGFYHGGYETRTVRGAIPMSANTKVDYRVWEITSRGYYHYIGA